MASNYRSLTAAEKDTFRANNTAGVNPVERCGVCGHKTITVNEIPRFCDFHMDWEPGSTEVKCYGCKVVYRVLAKGRCTA